MFRGVFERIADNPFGALAGEHGILDHGFIRGVFIPDLAFAAVFALGIFADHDEIDLFVFDRGRETRKQLDRTEIDILVETDADREEQLTQGNVIGHAGETDRAEQDRIAVRQDLHAVIGHHVSGFEVILAAPFQILEIEGDAAVFLFQCLQNADCFVDHIHADPVARYQLNDKFIHDVPFLKF